MAKASLFIQAPSEHEVLKRIEMVSDTHVRSALLALFYWRLAAQSLVEERPQSITRTSS